jgi:hypothetical protein
MVCVIWLPSLISGAHTFLLVRHPDGNKTWPHPTAAYRTLNLSACDGLLDDLQQTILKMTQACPTLEVRKL